MPKFDYWHGPDDTDRREKYAESFKPEYQAAGDETDRKIRTVYAVFCAESGLDPAGMKYASGWRPKAVNDVTKNSASASPHLEGAGGDVECDLDGSFAWWCYKNTWVLERHGLYMEHPVATVVRARKEKRQPWCHLQSRAPRSNMRVFWPDGMSVEEWAKFEGTEEAEDPPPAPSAGRKRRQAGFVQGAALYVLIALGVALALAAGRIWQLEDKLTKAEEKRLELASALAKEQQSRAGFQAAAQSCGASVLAMERRALAAEAEHVKKRRESQALSESVQAHIQAMLTRPRDKGLDECQAMRRELDDEIDFRSARRS